MIKLIATDIDGTLLKEGTDQINPEMYEVIVKLKQQGVIFAAASGRTYSSLRRLFDPVATDMIFIAENGANVICRNYQMDYTLLNRKDAEDLAFYIRKLPGCCLTASTVGPIYVEDRDPGFLDLLVNGYHNDVRVVEDVLKEEIKLIKMSIYKEDGVQDIAESVIREWQDRFRVAVAGDPWIDFMDRKADKGHALQKIQKIMKIAREETMVFGDNFNDIGMLNAAGESYAVASAHPEVQKKARHIAPSCEEEGVLKVLKELLMSISAKQEEQQNV